MALVDDAAEHLSEAAHGIGLAGACRKDVESASVTKQGKGLVDSQPKVIDPLW